MSIHMLEPVNLTSFLLSEFYSKNYITDFTIKECSGGYRIQLKYYLQDFSCFITTQTSVGSVVHTSDPLLAFFHFKNHKQIKKQLIQEVSVALEKFKKLQDLQNEFLYF